MSDQQDIYIPKIVVASVDILGIRNLLKKEDASLSAMNTLAAFRRNAAGHLMFADSDLTQVEAELYRFDEYLGDSIYLFPDPQVDIPTQAYFLAIRCASLIAAGIMIDANNFLVRAGIASGNLRRRVIQTEFGTRAVFIGSAMAKAHAIEQAQRWIGGAIEADLPSKEPSPYRMSYDVPTKPFWSTPKEQLDALNWVHFFADQFDLSKLKERLEEISCKIGGSEDQEHEKIDNTFAFIDQVVEKNNMLWK